MAPITTPQLDQAQLNALLGRSLLTTMDYTTPELEALMAVARELQRLDRMGKPTHLLNNELAWALFFDQSTRTKSAWAGASSRLGMNPVIVDGSSTQVSHGETPSETGAMLGMNSHALGVRHDLILHEGNKFMRELKRGIDDYLKATDDPRKVPIVNLQCDVDHPTQTMADLMWIRDNLQDGLQGKKITISWAYSPSYAKPLSVPGGLVMLLTRFGANVTLAHPEGYPMLDQCMDAARKNSAASGGSFRVVHDMEESFQGAHVVYPKSWGPYDVMMERIDANKKKDAAKMKEIEAKALEQNAKYKHWICDEKKMAATHKGDALYMHCLPADIGAEVSPGVMQKHVVNVAKEANWKVYVIMALLATAKVKDLAKRLADLG
jgi:knotted carbamoyltransferase YgeW